MEGTEETLRDIQIMFKHFDKDNTGFLEHAELKSCLRALGVNMSIPDDPAEPVPEFEEILNKLDPNRDGRVSLNEYTSFMIQRETSKVSGTANVIAAFKWLIYQGSGTTLALDSVLEACGRSMQRHVI